MNPDEIRTTILKAMFSSDELDKALTLKGGNALKLHNITDRFSQDFDFSIPEGERFNENDAKLFKKALENKFNIKGFDINNFQFKDKPLNRHNVPDFWGGYSITFSIIGQNKHKDLKDRGITNVSAYGESLENGSKKIEIDISFDEEISNRVNIDIEDVTIYLYSPLMIIYEKIRASCQQLEGYSLSSNKTRARDLFDIYSILTDFRFVELRDGEVLHPKNFDILTKMFKLKEVPLSLIPQIKGIKEELRFNYKEAVIPQIPSNEQPVEFDFLFNYNMELFDKLYEKVTKHLND